jgi:hypothetical protein
LIFFALRCDPCAADDPFQAPWIPRDRPLEPSMADVSVVEKRFEHASLPVNNPDANPAPKTRGIRPEGESGRAGVHPFKFLRICYHSSCTLSQYVNTLWPVVPVALAMVCFHS